MLLLFFSVEKLNAVTGAICCWYIYGPRYIGHLSKLLIVNALLAYKLARLPLPKTIHVSVVVPVIVTRLTSVQRYSLITIVC